MISYHTEERVLLRAFTQQGAPCLTGVAANECGGRDRPQSVAYHETLE